MEETLRVNHPKSKSEPPSPHAQSQRQRAECGESKRGVGPPARLFLESVPGKAMARSFTRQRVSGSPRKLILSNGYSPGDIVMMTAAVRDLHLCYPGQFLTDVRTRCEDLWHHNPFITPLPDDEPGVERLDCEYPLINRANDLPYHCLHGYIEFLNEALGLSIKPTAYKGDIHLSPLEKSWASQIY